MADFVSWGLWALSLELERLFGGLRSSSERERVIGRGWGPVVLLLRCLVVDGCLVLCFGFVDDEGVSNEPQEGTGGRLRLGEVMATFLFGCGCALGVLA